MPSLRARLLIGFGAGALVVALGWDDSDLGARAQWWAIVAAVLVAMAVAAALPVARELMPQPGMVPLTVAVSAAAVYGCVPETDPMFGVVLLVVSLAGGELVSRRQAPLAFPALACFLVLWAGVYGATGRKSALVGALFACWPVVIVPLVSVVLTRAGGRVPEPVWWMVAGLGGAASLVVARTGALADTVGPALVAVAVWGGASLVAALVLTTLSAALGRRRQFAR